SEEQEPEVAQSSNLCCIFAEPDGRRSGSSGCFALTHELLDARIGRQDEFFGASVSAARRLFVADGCARSLGFQLLISTLSRGSAVFLISDQVSSFNALDTYQVECAVVTPQVLSDLIAFYETKTELQSGLTNIFVIGPVSKSVAARASTTLGAKIWV